MNLLSIDTIAFTLLGYSMSYIELVGTVLYLWSVWLIARRNILTWPVGIVSVFLGHPGLGLGDLAHPWWVVGLLAVVVSPVVVGNLFPDKVSFLASMRYYAGN